MKTIGDLKILVPVKHGSNEADWLPKNPVFGKIGTNKADGFHLFVP
ncbi:hypothetical protein [Mesobacillus jeotgali]|nr:hypothetical protein [Mesobacillus jeotgali]